MGSCAPTSGEIRWDGTPTTELPRRTWGYLPEERGLYPRMTVLDQLVYFASAVRPARPTRPAPTRATGWPGSASPTTPTRRAEELSKGNQQKVQFIAAILHGPDVLLMDEPFTGLDPVNLALLREAFLELRDEGRTIVFSTHQMEAAEALCESLAIVDRGRVVAAGTLGELKRASRARTVRLGVDGRDAAGLAGRAARRRRRPARGRLRRARAGRRATEPVDDRRGCRRARRPGHPLRGRRARRSRPIFIELVGPPGRRRDADPAPTTPARAGLSVVEGAA